MEATVASEKALWMLDWGHLIFISNLFTVIYFQNCIDSLVYQWLKRACGARSILCWWWAAAARWPTGRVANFSNMTPPSAPAYPPLISQSKGPTVATHECDTKQTLSTSRVYARSMCAKKRQSTGFRCKYWPTHQHPEAKNHWHLPLQTLLWLWAWVWAAWSSSPQQTCWPSRWLTCNRPHTPGSAPPLMTLL